MPVAIAIVATHKARSPVAAADLGRPYERVTLRTRDGLSLAAWYVPSRNGAAVIAFPGRRQPVPHARMLVRHGYGVLLLDRRGEGASDGAYNAFGWTGEADVAAAVGYLRGRPEVDGDRIGGLGLSVGGELLLQTAARTRALRAVVSEGAGVRSLAEHLRHARPRPRPALVLELDGPDRRARGARRRRAAGRSDGSRRADRPAARAPHPSRAGRGRRGAQPGVRAQGRPRACGAPAGRHTGALAAQPAEYERRVIAFFGEALR